MTPEFAGQEKRQRTAGSSHRLALGPLKLPSATKRAYRRSYPDNDNQFNQLSGIHRPAVATMTTSPPFPESNAPSSSSISYTNNPSETGYDPSEPAWRKHFAALTGRMTNDGINYFREDLFIKNEAADVKRVEEYRDWLFTYSPTVIFMRKAIADLNGDLNETNVKCRRCPARRDEKTGQWIRQGGGFSPDHGILICANLMRDRKHMEDTMAHEMVHAWDHLRFKVDWTDLRHAACTEVCCGISNTVELY